MPYILNQLCVWIGNIIGRHDNTIQRAFKLAPVGLVLLPKTGIWFTIDTIHSCSMPHILNQICVWIGIITGHILERHANPIQELSN